MLLIPGLEPGLIRGDFAATVYGPEGRVAVLNEVGCWVWYQCDDCGRVYNTKKERNQCTHGHNR